MRYLRSKSPASLTFEIDDGKEEPYILPILEEGDASDAGRQQISGKKDAPEKKAANKDGGKSVAPKKGREKALEAGKAPEKKKEEGAVHIKTKSTEEELRAAKKAQEDLLKKGRNDYVPEGWGKKNEDD